LGECGGVSYRQSGCFDAVAGDATVPLYVLAQRRRDEPVTFPVEGFDGGSVSMLGLRVG
jgi:hypothetical protein